MSSITSNNMFYLRLFYQGITTDLCIELGDSFGRLFPSKAEGILIKKGELRNLKANGLITEEMVKVIGLDYKRYVISDFGRKMFEEYKNDCSK